METKAGRVQGLDATDRVREVLVTVVGRSLSSEALIHEVAEELYILHDRVKRVWALSDDFKGVQLSPHVTHLLKMVGKGVLVEPCELPRVAIG